MRTIWIVPTLSLLACTGKDGGSTPPPADFTVAVAPAEVSLAAGGATTVAVTIDRAAGFAGPVALALVGPTAGFTAAFAPNPAPGGSATLTLTAAGAGTGAHGLYVKGSSGADADAAALAVTILPDATFSVTGRVVDVFRQPLAGLEVRLGGASSVSDAEGRFSFAVVSPPYDLVVKRTAPLEAHQFRGLTRPDPVPPHLGTLPSAARVAPVSGGLSGGSGYPLPSGAVAALFFAAPQGFGGGYLFPGQGPAYGPFSASWYGPASMDGTWHALQWTVDALLMPQAFVAYGSAPLTVSEGLAASQDLVLGAAGTGFLSGTVTPPDGFTVASKTLWLTGGPFTGVFLGSEATADETFTYATPDVGLPVGLQAVATRGGKSTGAYRAGLLPSEVIDIALPAPPLLQAPPIGATGVTTATTFSWTAYPGSIHVAFFTPAAGATFVVYQAGTTATIPDLASIGLPLAAGAAATWSVWGVGPLADLDAYADPARALGLAGLETDALLGVAEPAAFTTAP